MPARLPRWVWWATWLLAAVAGLVDAVGWLGFRHRAASHLTGTTTLLGIALAERDAAVAIDLAVVLAAFVAGAATSGAIVRDGAFRVGRRYGLALACEAALLLASAPLLARGHAAGTWLASAACGLQNGMLTTFSGATVRTTHVSGMFTDLGIALGHFVVRRPVETLRARLALLVISAFTLGGTAGVLAWRAVGYGAMTGAGLVVLTLAAVYAGVRRRLPPVGDGMPSPLPSPRAPRP